MKLSFAKIGDQIPYHTINYYSEIVLRKNDQFVYLRLFVATWSDLEQDQHKRFYVKTSICTALERLWDQVEYANLLDNIELYSSRI